MGKSSTNHSDGKNVEQMLNTSSRRSILRSVVGTSALLAAGPVKAAGSNSDVSEENVKRAADAKQRRNNPEAVQAALAEHASGLLKELNSRELLPYSAPREVVRGQMLAAKDMSILSKGALVTTMVDDSDEVRTHIQVNHVPRYDRRIAVVVLPEAQRSYAVVRQTRDGSSLTDASNDTETQIIETSQSEIGPVEPMCHSALFCHMDPNGNTCLVNDCLLKEMKCCSGTCYEEFLRTCDNCCDVSWQTCDSVTGGCP